MGLKETKYYFENMFNEQWVDTPIHFAGQDFDIGTHEKWINPVYNPMSGRSVSVSNVGSRNHGSLVVVCWADNDVNVMELADDVVTFMEANVEKNQYALKGYSVEDHAWHKSDKVYIYLSFTVVSYFC